MSSGKTYSLIGLRAEPCTNRKPFSLWTRGRSARNSQRWAILLRFSMGASSCGTGPEDGPLGRRIEAFRIEHGALIVIAQEDDLAFHDQIDALARIGPVADDVAQAIDFGDVLRFDVLEHRLQGLEIAVDIADDGFHDHSPLHPSRPLPKVIEVGGLPIYYTPGIGSELARRPHFLGVLRDFLSYADSIARRSRRKSAIAVFELPATARVVGRERSCKQFMKEQQTVSRDGSLRAGGVNPDPTDPDV